MQSRVVLMFFVACLAASSVRGASYVVTDLGAMTGLPGVVTYPVAINNDAHVVGSFSTPQNDQRAFLYSEGALTDLGTFGGTISYATGINDLGQVAGYAQTSGNAAYRAFIYNGGVKTQLGTLGGNNSFATDINSSGDVIGISNAFNGVEHAFLYRNGVMTDLGALGGNSLSHATGINGAGHVVGYSYAPSIGGAFVFNGTSMTSLGRLGGNFSEAWGINDSEQIVGRTDVVGSTYRHAFVHSGGLMTDLGTLGGSYSGAWAINSHGVIVGYSERLNGGQYAFVYRNGSMQDLTNLIDPPPGMWLTDARGINDHGQIVAYGYVNGSSIHGFLLTPVPEPGSCALALGALLCFVVVTAVRSTRAKAAV